MAHAANENENRINPAVYRTALTAPTTTDHR
jgi:hypothetical protein